MITSKNIRSLKNIETTEGISLTVELSGVPARLVAFLIDAWAAVGILLFLSIILTLGLSAFESALRQILSEYDWRWISAEIIGVSISLLTLSFFFSYFFLQEWLWGGRTLGKALMKIRTVRNNGQPIGFWESFGRNIFRLVDVMVSGLGVIIMLFSPTEKRLGDYLAGSLVITDESLHQHHWIKRSLLEEDLNHSALSEQAESSESNINSLSHEEKALLQAWQTRSKQIFESNRRQIDFLLRQYFAFRLRASKEEAQAPQFLTRLLSARLLSDG